MDHVSKAQQETLVPTSHSKRLLRGGHDPSIGRQWPKGVSGNPGGRRKKAPVTKMLEEIFDDPTQYDEIKDSMGLTLKSGRMAGILLFREAAERLEGKVSQPVEMSGEINIGLAETIQQRRKRLGNSNSKP